MPCCVDGKDDERLPQASSARRPRADARRNRERLLAAAKAAFLRDATGVSLDDIAREAGVGIGTLYRHFPTRDALIEAVYRAEVDALAAAADRLAATEPPLEALRGWMLLSIDTIAAKVLIAPALNCLVGGPSRLFESSGASIRRAIGMLVERAVAAGDVRADLEPLDLLHALVGMANVSAGPGWEASARRLVDILVAGSRQGSAMDGSTKQGSTTTADTAGAVPRTVAP